MILFKCQRTCQQAKLAKGEKSQRTFLNRCSLSSLACIEKYLFQYVCGDLYFVWKRRPLESDKSFKLEKELNNARRTTSQHKDQMYAVTINEHLMKSLALSWAVAKTSETNSFRESTRACAN